MTLGKQAVITIGCLAILALVAVCSAGENASTTVPVVPVPARDAVQPPSLDARDDSLGVVPLPALRVDRRATGGTLPDFAADGNIPVRKEHFFSYLLPLVQTENDRIAGIRKRLRCIREYYRWGRQPSEQDVRWLGRVVAEYRLPSLTPHQPEFWQMIMRRVDVLPTELVLVQAANESAWGTSRFAREGNNLFGQWCFGEGCGMVPFGRPEGASYEVARYDSVQESVGSYLHNLNTGDSYRYLRDIRARERAEGREPAANALATGLQQYSERGLEYVDELRAMIRHNADIIDQLNLRNADDGNS